MMEPWSQTYTGRAFPLTRPKATDVHWADIAYGLAHINRFCGAAGTYSVAQHSLIVADQLPRDIRLYGLLHDAHEAYLGDIPTPVKNSFWDEGLWQLDALVDHVDAAIYAHAGLEYPIPAAIASAVLHADRRAIMTERRDLMKKPPKSWGDEFESMELLPERIEPWQPLRALSCFSAALLAKGLPVDFVARIV